MAFKRADRVKDTTATAGLVSIVLDNATPAGFQSFLNGIGNSNSFPYAILGKDVPSEWETGIGTLSGGTTISRDLVLDGSAGLETKVNFSSGAKDVICAPLAKGRLAANDITPTALTADVDDYAPTGGALADVWYVSADIDGRAINGINSGNVHGRLLILVNNSTTGIILNNQSGTSSAANRFLLCANQRVLPGGGGAITLIYSSIDGFWRELGSCDGSNKVLTSADSPYTPTIRDRYLLCDTSSGTITINMPSSVLQRDLFIKDTNGTFATNNVTLVPNGSDKFEGLSGNLILSANFFRAMFRSSPTLVGWFKF